MAKIIKSNILPILLALISLFLCFRNYSSGTFLTGWDTLHPEFNYRIYWPRILDGVWQEHQGLGAVASQAHASEIPRILVLMLLDLFLPMNMVRYAYAFLMLILGPLGVFFFVRKGIFGGKREIITESAAFCAGLFYLMNLVTLQHFYIPLEMFLTHYGYLGFFMLAVVLLLRDWSRKNLIFFVLVSFLITPQAHTSTLFYALLANLLGFFFIYWVSSKLNIGVLKNFLRLFGVLMIVNAFWLLPNLYFAINHGGEVQDSKIHSLFNQEAFLQNQAFGNIKDMALGKGFLFNWGEHAGNLEFRYLLDEWQYHHTRPGILVLGYSLFFCALAGIAFSSFHKRKEALSVAGMLLVSMFFLFNLNPPTGVIYKLLQDNIPLFDDAFRFPFTKFSISLVFSYSVFFGFFVFGILSLMGKILKFGSGRSVKVLSAAVVLLCLVGLSAWMLPAFKGGLISSSMRVEIPDRYFELFDYLNEKDDFGRVANLPIHTFWGWVYHNWDEFTKLGYQGAGFLWFGIKQPLMDREFDRWNTINQHYYKDMTKAVYAQDTDLLLAVLDKYKIRWLIHDESVIAPGNDPQILFIEEIKTLLRSTDRIKIAANFGDGLTLYEYEPEKAFELTESVSGAVVNREEQYAFREAETSSEELDLDVVSSSPEKLTFYSGHTSDLHLDSKEDVYLPCDLYAKVASDGLWLRFVDTVHKDQIYFEERVYEGVLENGILDVDGSIVTFGSIDQEYRKIGHLYVPLYRPMEFRLYSTGDIARSYDISNMYSELEVCSDVGSLSSYTVTRRSSGFSLSGKNADACVTSNLMDLLPGLENTTGMLLGLEVAGVFSEEPCIFNQRTTLCENHPVSKGLSYISLEEGVDTYNLRFYARALGNIIEASQVYDSVTANIRLPVVERQIYPADSFIAEALEKPLLENFDFVKPVGFGGYAGTLISNSRYCRSGERYRADTPFGDSRFYVTSDDEICDTFPFPLARHSLGHVLEISARNITGVPLRICLTNEYSKRCDKYIELPAEKEMSTHFYLVPPMGEETDGYVVNISNLAFAGLPSQNELGYIGLTPIPYNFLMNVSSTKELVVEDMVLVYNQSFEKGWVALCGLGTCDADHIMVDGWANGWVFQGSIPDNVRIVFWPQILEYLGFALIATFSAILIRAGRYSRERLERVSHSLDKPSVIG